MAKLKIPTYQEIRKMTPKEIRSNLKRLRGVAEKRLKALFKAGKQDYISDLGAITSGFKNGEEELANISIFLRKPFSKLSNIKKFEKDMYRTLKDHGYDIKKEDVAEFNRFMGEIKAMYKGRRIPDSDRVAEAFIQAQRLKMSNRALKANLDYWREHLEDLKKVPTSKAKSRYSANQIKHRVKLYNKKKKI